MSAVSTELTILGLLAAANALMTMSETAFVSARKSVLRERAQTSAAAARACELAEKPARFLALVQHWLTFSIVVAGIIAGAGLSGPIAAWIAQAPVLAPHARLASFAVVAIALSTLLLYFGELVPKRIGLAHPEKVAVLMAGLVRLPTAMAGPILDLLESATTGFTRLMRIRPRTRGESVDQDEVRTLVEEGLHAGVFQRAETEMIERVMALGHLRVTAIMTPRPKIVFLNLDDPEEANWRKIVSSGHSYFPVYQGNRDQIVGLVSVKALWAHSAIGLPTLLKNLLVPPLVVTETTTGIQLLEQFKKSGRHTAIVTDEFGAVQGLVTLIDVLEAIVGDLPEPGRRNQPQARKREDGSLLIDATLPVGELKSLLGFEGLLPHEKEAEFQTVGGFFLTQFGRIPDPGDRFGWNGWRFEVVEMDRHRIDKVAAIKADSPAP